MQTPTPVNPVPPSIVLDQHFAEHQDAIMSELGAVNTGPALARSSHLKNIKTGRVFPWTEILAEQRDILVNCDANGNTDEASWRASMIPEGTIVNNEALHGMALDAIRGKDFRQPMPATMQAKLNDPEQMVMPHGAVPYHKSEKLSPASEQALASLENLF